jgi:transcriptional regulator with GAF, ATPase, and Fis domain
VVLFAGTYRQLAGRRGLLSLAGLVVFVYTLSVLYYSISTPDLSLKSTFSPEVKGEAFEVEPEPGGPVPQTGDRVTKAGYLTIQSWPDLVTAPLKLRDKLAEHEPALPEDWARRAATGSQDILVKVRFERDGKPFDAWCRLGQLPVRELAPSLLWFLLKMFLFSVGALVMWKRPTDRAASQFFLLCVVTLGAYMGGYHWMHILTAPTLLVGFMVCGVLLPVVNLHFNLLFPHPKALLERFPRRILLAIYLPPLAVLGVLLSLYLRFRWLYQHGAATADLWAIQEPLRITIYVSFLMSAVWYVVSVLALVHSFRTVTDPTERNQVKWIMFGALLSLLPVGVALGLAVWWPDYFGVGGATWPMFAASVLVTAAFVIAITRYRLMELDQLISSGAVYFLISFLAALIYFVVVFVAAFVFNRSLAGPSLTDALTVSTTALLLMLVLDLARSRLRRALDRRFSREKYQLDRTLQRMSEAVQQLVDPPTLLARLLQASAELLGVSLGAAYLRQGEGRPLRRAALLGPAAPPEEASSDEWRGEGESKSALASRFGFPVEVARPLTHEGRLLAVLLLGPRGRGPYRPEDLSLLAALAQMTALALAGAEGHHTIELLNQDLQTKVEKIAEQQRRILALQSQLRRKVGSGQWVVGSGKQPPNSSTPNDRNGPATTHYPLPTAHLSPGIIGSSLQVRHLLDLVRKVSATEAVVLIRGESGTGKELLAQAVHEASPRAGKAFVKVHCAALSPTLLESELFGHVKGAFTGAISNKVGRFELANGGTLFLDEIGDISLEVQTKLLRVLQEKTIERVGSGEPVKVDVRILAATHQDLEGLIREGRFREDLFYRLNVFPIRVPPLRERPEDIPELALYFLQRCAERCKRPVLPIDDDALSVLKAYPWPGNVRQLENVIERAVVIAEGPAVTVAELDPELVQATGGPGDWPAAEETVADGYRRQRAGREKHERELILQALERAGGNKAEAARALGLARSTLVSRLKKYGMEDL